MAEETGKALLMVRTNVKAGGEEAFNEWYSNVHLPEIVEVPGIRWGRRYQLSGSDTYPKSEEDLTYLAIYELDDEGVLDGSKFAEAKGWSPEVEGLPEDTQVAVFSLLAAEEEK